MRKVRLGFLVALVATLSVAGGAYAQTPESSNDIDLATFDVFRTGTPAYDLVLRSSGEVGPLVLEHLRWPGGVRADGYYWLPIEEDERDIVHDVIEKVQQMMGEDFPIAVSVVRVGERPRDAILAEAIEMGAIDEEGLAILLHGFDYGKADIYRTGTPDYDLVKEFYKEFDVRNLKYWSDLISAVSAGPDGYYWLLVREDDWDRIQYTIDELRGLMGDDLPIAVEIGEYTHQGTAIQAHGLLDEASVTATASDVFGGHRCVIQRGVLNYNVQTLGFAALRGGEVGMVLSGHYKTLFGWIPMPLNALVYSPTSFYPFLTNLIGLTECVGGDYSDSSYMGPFYGGDRIKPGVEYYGTHMPVWGPENTQVDDWVYQTGSQTGTSLGQVLAFVTVDDPAHGTLYEQAVATYVSAEGDSGAPVYWIRAVDWPIPLWYPPYPLPEFVFLKGVNGGEITYYGVQRPVFSTLTQVIDDLSIWPLPGPFG